MMHRATVTKVVDEKGYALALSDMGQSFLLPQRNFERLGVLGFDDLRIGSVVEFTAIEGPRGLRGVDIRVVIG